MKELFGYLASIGWFGGTLEISFNMLSSFEGFSGRASETWEQQYEFICNGIKGDDGKWLIEPIKLKSKVYESPDDFCKRVLSLIKH